MTMTCDDYEILAERALRDDLPDSERGGLERHLGECDSCREFSNLAAALDGALRQRSVRAGPAPDAGQLRAAFVHRERRRRARLWSALPGVALIIALFGWAHGPGHAWMLIGVSVALVVFGLFRVVLPARRRAAAALAPDGDLLEAYCSDLDREIKGLRTARPLVPVLLIVFALVVALQPIVLVKQHLLGEDLSWRSAVAMTLVLGYLTYSSWRDDRVTLPRLERERDGLDA